jgi:molybdenum cofactor synthesis domain-containing protein
MSTAGLLVIGNEILSGKVVDVNSPYLAAELRPLGVELQRILTIPDAIDIIANEVRVMSKAYDHVFTSGGIGPTHDDVTLEGVALAFGRELVLDEVMCRRMEDAVGRPLNESMRKMAMLPEGCERAEAENLWFPVVAIENVYIFPGIPELFRKKFDSVRDRFRGVPFELKRVYVTQHESEIAHHLNSLLSDFAELMLGSYPRLGEPDYRVMLTLESRDAGYLERALASLLDRLPADVVHRVE